MAKANKIILKVEKLSAVFENNNGGLKTLEDISFSIQESEFVCLLGPSGSGKTTLLRILAGLLSPTEGSVYLDDEEITEPRPGVGIVFQQANLMPWRTVYENIILPLEVKENFKGNDFQLVHDLIKLVGLEGFEEMLPRDLSGGMAQRVAIARSLINDPDILILDEPFGALDAITREKMGEELLRIWNTNHKTVLMVTHDVSEALYLADRVLVLTDRPAKINLDLKVDLPRPRHDEMRYTPEFGELVKILRQAIG